MLGKTILPSIVFEWWSRVFGKAIGRRLIERQGFKTLLQDGVVNTRGLMERVNGVRGRTVLVLLAGLMVGLVGPAGADDIKKPASSQDGKYVDAEGAPTYNIGADGKVDWYAFSGYRRYHSECHVCHGPDGAGSTYAPALADSLKHMDYYQFAATVAQGRKDVSTESQKVMPAFGENKNVMCYLDDIYVYLKARADGALPRIRPENHESKPEAAKQAENSCMGF